MTIDKKYNPRCFFDVEIAGQPAGRVVFELFAKVCPITCENFRALCTGECGVGKTTGKPLHYKGVKFHRVIKSFMIQGGDFSVGNGSGGESIYGGTFKDECFDMKHDRPYLLSMANRGKDTNGSQFFITTQQTPHLDGVHVVFGQVIKGEEVVKEVENQPTDNNSCPLRPVTIANCGELVLKRKQKGKRQKKSGSASSEAESLASSPEKAEKKHKKHHKHKRSSKKEKHKRRDDCPEEEAVDLDGDHSLIKPEEIPEIPANNFLMRRVPTDADTNYAVPERRMGGYYSRRPKVSRSGRKIKGRGFMRYRTPSPEGGRSGSETPPHWKQAQSRMKPLKDYMELAQEMEGEEGGDVAEPVDPVQKDGKPRSSENTERRRDRRRDYGDRGDRDYPRGRRSDRDASRKHQDENHPPTEQPRRQRKFEENPRRSNHDPEEKERHRSRSRDRDRPRGSYSRQRNREPREGKPDRDSATRQRRHDHQRKSPSKVNSTATHNGESTSSAHSAAPLSGKGTAPAAVHKDKRGLSATPAAAPQPPTKAPRRFEEHPHGGEDGDAAAGSALRTRLPMTQLLDPTEPLPPGVEPDEVTSCLNTPGSLPSSQMKWGMVAQGGGTTVSTAQASVSDPKTKKSNSPLVTKVPVESRHSRPSVPVQAETRKNPSVPPPTSVEPGRTTQSSTALRASERQLGLNQKTASSQQAPAPSATSSASTNSNAKMLGETSGRQPRAKDTRSRSRSRGHGRNRSRSGSASRRRHRRSSSAQVRKRNRSASSSSSSAGSRRRGRGGAKGRRGSSEESRGKGRRSGRGRRGGRRRSSSSSSKSSSSSSSSSSAGVRGGRGGRKRKGSTRTAGAGRRRRRSSSSGSSSSSSD